MIIICCSPVDAFDPDLKTFPRFYRAQYIETELYPGEMLIIPTGWFHQVNFNNIYTPCLIIFTCDKALETDDYMIRVSQYIDIHVSQYSKNLFHNRNTKGRVSITYGFCSF